METQSNGFAVGRWFAMVAACASTACAGGYLVGMDLTKVKSTLATRDAELAGLHQQMSELANDLQKAEKDAARAKNMRERTIESLESALVLKEAQLELASRLIVKKDAMALEAFEFQSPLTLKQIVIAKNSFHDIQHEVAAGNFKGLDLTNAYQRLKAIFENPELEDLNIAYDEAKAQVEELTPRGSIW